MADSERAAEIAAFSRLILKPGSNTWAETRLFWTASRYVQYKQECLQHDAKLFMVVDAKRQYRHSKEAFG